MKRTITMNLNGTIFHIEEDAYEKLNNYLLAIKSYFKNNEGCDEIMDDIEARIAEMLQAKVSNSKQAVVMADIENVVTVMGNPEDFAGETENTKNADNNNKTSENSDSTNYSGRRRVFRDPDDKIVGGVCSGIANYFDVDPIWLRAAFAVSFFVFGSGLLLYMILCMIIPKARTTAEKLEMRGEKVDVNNIGKAVNEEFQDFKKRMNDFGKEMQSNESKQRMKSTVQKMADFIKDLLYRIFKVVGKTVAFLLIFIGIVLMVAFLATLFGRGTISIFNSSHNTIHFSLYELSSDILPNGLPLYLLVVGLMLFIGIPLMYMIYNGIKFLFGFKHKNKFIKYVVSFLWFCGLGLLVYIGFETGSDFSEEASVKQTIDIIQPTGNVFYLDVNQLPGEDDGEITYKNRHSNHFEIVAIKTANGCDPKDAANRAKSINYKAVQTDSLISFNSFFEVKGADKLRAQNVRLVVKVPVGKEIYLSKQMEDIIFDIDNVNNTLDNDMVDRKWKMTKRGLECVDCKGI